MKRILLALAVLGFGLGMVGASQVKHKQLRVKVTAGAPSGVLTWTQPTKGCTGSQSCTYNIYRGLTSGGETEIATGQTGTTYTDTGVTRGVTYFWQVSASNNIGEGGKSNEATGTIPDVPGTPGTLTVATN